MRARKECCKSQLKLLDSARAGSGRAGVQFRELAAVASGRTAICRWMVQAQTGNSRR